MDSITAPSHSAENTEVKSEEDWHDVGIVNSTTCTVSSYYVRSNPNDHSNTDEPDVLKKVNLEPGTIYKFRVAGINGCGRGPWSEISYFKTSIPGFLGAPTAVNITKSNEGAILSWNPPSYITGVILDYSVSLAVKEAIKPNTQDAVLSNLNQLAFVKVYCGSLRECIVPNKSLSQAYIDTSNKAAIIFRITARNHKGSGPATQVNWLQELSYQPQPIQKVSS